MFNVQCSKFARGSGVGVQSSMFDVECSKFVRPASRSSGDQFQKLRVGFRLRQSRDHRLGRLLDLLLNEGATEEMDSLERLRVDQELLLPRAAGGDIDRGPEAHLG